MLQKKRRRKNTLNSEPQRTIRVSHVRRTPGATTTRGNMQTANRKPQTKQQQGKVKAESKLCRGNKFINSNTGRS
jgi:hypothetical protein